jgi:hypothetical protein
VKRIQRERIIEEMSSTSFEKKKKEQEQEHHETKGGSNQVPRMKSRVQGMALII